MRDRNYNVDRTQIQWMCAVNTPVLIHRACVNTGTLSQTRYIQEAVAARLAEDLGMDYDDLMGQMPPPRSLAAFLIGPGQGKRSWAISTPEDVR